MGGPTGTPLSVRVVRSIADARDVEPMDIGFRLGDAIDTDALDELAEHDGGDWELQFEADGHEVEISSGGPVIVDGEAYR
jgi:hypothetical protein